MSEPAYERPSGNVWTTPVLTWIVMILLLAANCALAFAPLGRAKTSVNFAIAITQVLLIGLFFMRLTRSSRLVRLTAVTGFFWLVFLFVFAGADYLTRP